MDFARMCLESTLSRLKPLLRTTHPNNGKTFAVSIYAPFRFLIAAAGALLVATVIASSSPHALLLGDAVAQSAFGMPLRAVRPVRPAPRQALAAARCQLQ